MRYEHIWRYVVETPWAIDPTKLQEIVGVLSFRSAGGTFTAEEIQGRIGGGTTTVPSQGAVAVLSIRGTICHRMGTMAESSGGISAERIGAMIRQAMADQTVGSIVLDIDSPGGTVTGMQELADELLAARGKKPIVAVANAMMASGAYWIAAAAADEIVATPSALVGSIGVYGALADYTKAFEQEGVKVHLLKAGKFKAEGFPGTPITEEQREHLQSQIEEAYAAFTRAVARGRGVPIATVRDGYGEGRSLTAKPALEAGLVDRIETLEATIRRMTKGQQGKVAGAAAEDLGADLALQEWAIRLR